MNGPGPSQCLTHFSGFGLNMNSSERLPILFSLWFKARLSPDCYFWEHTVYILHSTHPICNCIVYLCVYLFTTLVLPWNMTSAEAETTTILSILYTQHLAWYTVRINEYLVNENNNNNKNPPKQNKWVINKFLFEACSLANLCPIFISPTWFSIPYPERYLKYKICKEVLRKDIMDLSFCPDK